MYLHCMKIISGVYFLILSLSVFAQQKVKYVFDVDSLSGFNEPLHNKNAIKENMFGQEYKSYMYRAKRNFLKDKYSLESKYSNSFNLRPPNSNNQIMAACTNLDFEAGNLAGWTETNGFNTNSNTMAGCCPTAGGNALLISGGTDPLTGISLNSPLGGNWVCKINDQTTGGYTDRISQTFNVTPANSLIQFAYLAVLEAAGHNCPDQPYMNIRLLDCNNNIIPCPQVDIQAGTGCGSVNGFVNGGSFFYTNAWQVSALDLTPYIGSCITIQVTAGACTQGGHWGYGYIDAKCLPMNVTVNNTQFPVGTNATNVAVCGNLTGTITAPPGLGPYMWNGPAGSGVTNLNSQTFTTSTVGTYTLTMNPIGSCGPIIRLVNLQIVATPIAAFNFTNSACSGSINCINTSSVNSGPVISGIQWVWNDATPNLTVNPASHTYTTSGPKQIKLIVTNLAGCKDSISHTIVITQKPTANFIVNDGCSGTAFNFTNMSTTSSGVYNSSWNFGNTNVSTVTNPTHTYLISGNFFATLIVTNSDNCIDSITKPVNVFGHALVNFTTTNVCFGSANNFINLSNTTTNANTGNVLNNNWFFGDGGFSAAQNPIHTYTASSNLNTNTVYSVSLVVTTQNGCKDSLTKQLTVYSLPTPNFTSDSVCVGNLTNLLDASNNNGNSFLLFSWDFNNDNVADLTNNSITSTHLFPNAGNTSVTYTVFTSPNNGLLICSNKITKTIFVNDIPNAVISFTNKCINAQPNLFNGTNSTVPTGTIINYAWNYGNGNFSQVNAGPTSSFSYNTAGNYSVTLTVTSSNGCNNSISKIIEVWDKPYATFACNTVCAGKTAIIKGSPTLSSPVITNYEWDFNGILSSIEASGIEVTNVFPTEGNHPVNLFIKSDQGCKNSISGNIYVNYNPKPNFYAPKRSGCSDLCISVMDDSQALPGPAKNVMWQWNFGTNEIKISDQPTTQTICFTNPSNILTKDYSLKLTLTTDSGCVDSIIKPNYIHAYPKPLANFEWVGKEGNILAPFISFQNVSIGYNSFYWYYNDGINITDSLNNNPTHYYNTDIPQDFNVFLAVKNQFGCIDTVSKYIEIGPEYTFYIPNTFTPNSDGINETFTGAGIGIKDFAMWIFDRWGEMIYFTNDIKKGWDATVKGKEVSDKMDVYAYKVIVKDIKNKQHEYTGHVTLLK